MDIIEIALDNYTDFKRFERLATEIMALDGYTDIKPIGGVDDEGVDAEITRYFKDEVLKIIFQYSNQATITSKIKTTIDALNEKGHDFDELIIVTKNKINNIQHIRRATKEKYKVKLDIIDKDTFIKHLSVRQDIFLRYFPDIKSQIQSDLLGSKSIFSKESGQTLETALLKCSLLFTFNNKSESARKDLFDFTILGIIVNEKVTSREKLKAEFIQKFNKDINDNELDSVIDRLSKAKLVDDSKTQIQPSKRAIELIEGTSSRVNSETQALIDDILRKTISKSTEKIDLRTERKISDNVKQSLTAYFSLYGLEYTDAAKVSKSKFGFNDNTDLIALAKQGLPDKLGELLVYSIGTTLREPTPDQANVLADWAKAFLGLQIMGLDPKLNNFQNTKISKKSFILDTDFLLYCLVDDCKLSSTYQKIIKQLQELRCKIYLPKEVIYESIKHAEFATRNYNYFKNTFEAVDEIIIDEKIVNVFVKGYYHCLSYGKLDSTAQFQTYLENFYNKDAPYQFILEVIEHKLPGIEIKSIEELTSRAIPHEKVHELTELILDETKKTFKAAYRSDEENYQIAKTDSELFLHVYYLNQLNERDKGTLLSGSHYLLTSSTRAQRCAKKLGYSHNVISKPHTILSLLDKLGKFKVSSSELVNLFENPYLIDAVNSSWDDIKALVDTGVNLKGKDIIKLRWELDSEIKQFLTESKSIESKETVTVSVERVGTFVGFVKRIKDKGYLLIPETDQLIEKYEEMEKKVVEKEVKEKILMTEIEKFGKRRQKYFDKISSGKGK